VALLDSPGHHFDGGSLAELAAHPCNAWTTSIAQSARSACPLVGARAWDGRRIEYCSQDSGLEEVIARVQRLTRRRGWLRQSLWPSMC
jgi:hypothetical protein